ncbi:MULTISPECIES: c-type cytochrome biogenesis protein CcmI [unclassified Vibrio]|uniref:c-type cytochrome biogenesis protein CcmI n=1 Tax=unclassified Vibrio TaxID=2614977 RepID=UPI000B8E73CA|nr:MULTISPECIES: c-type cytochrome biogenesis protein CcmI [unclassified Vibrio]NAW92031.1 c-type cytochrome biogenesis protein CcmI [Vibrio sp. V24_P1S3T111]OXX22513.1 c-type cytochrome biogenesis protein CcmI [Vibrio sp. V06_P1A73T115]OXX23732.1 c-type cytochrome biogenesis protein CcmI [Vibrio sp. V05_P4A8T149]OXX30253.1 c-type cytochrome biogenesis protein CcmI [Vibrio sp. V04_P4A5T148]OXX36462.1 c-type cytochrome biogenesis protein CcmI [Vibrio sp. V14_P6S14T42]
MTFFWLSTLILTFFGCVFIALPILKNRVNNDAALRDELNKAIFKNRLAELHEETQEGLVDSEQELIADLKQSLLDDIPAQSVQGNSSHVSPMVVLIPSILLVVILSYGFYLKFGAASQVEQWQQVNANLPALSKKMMSPEGAALSDDEMNDLTLALRTRLHYQPQDATGWLLLGRIGLANRDIETSIGSMKKAYALDPKDADVKLGYAQALMLSQDELDQNQAREILTALVQQDYVDLRVFSLLAFDAFERQDYPAAMKYWRLMQQMIGPEDSRYEMLSRSIERAQSKMQPKAIDGKMVPVTISLGDGVTLEQNAVLIVSVHSSDGAPMPVAAARYPLTQFPIKVVLDDSNSMVQGRKLSDLAQLIVRVRLDTDGNVSTKQGDWFGESAPMSLGQPVEVVINKQY